MQGLPPILTIALFVGGAVGLVVIINVLVARRIRQVTAEWQAYAQQRNAQLGGYYPAFTIHAQIDGIAVSLVHHVHHGSKGRRYYRHEAIAAIPVNTGDLIVSRQGLFEMLGKIFGGQDIEVGDPRFDPRFVVRSAYPDATRGVLTQNAIEALLSAQAAISDVFLEQNAMRCIGNGPATPAICDRLLITLARTAASIGR